MELKKSIFDIQPSLVESEGAQVRINFDVEQVEMPVADTAASSDEADEDQELQNGTRVVFEAYVVRVAQPLSRDGIVNAIVSAAYPQDRMQAIINNHALDEEDDESYSDHLAEWKEMQQWRKHAKEVAQSVMKVSI